MWTTSLKCSSEPRKRLLCIRLLPCSYVLLSGSILYSPLLSSSALPSGPPVHLPRRAGRLWLHGHHQFSRVCLPGEPPAHEGATAEQEVLSASRRCVCHGTCCMSTLVPYVTVSEKTDHLAQVLDIKIYPVVACYSLYAMVKSESR